MTIFHTAVMVIIALDSIYLLSLFVWDFCDKVKSYRKKKAGKPDDEFDFLYDDEDSADDWDGGGDSVCEFDIPELGADALVKVKPEPKQLNLFIEEKILPEAPRTICHMTYDDQRQVKRLLSAFIGFLLDTAPDYEKDFTILLELLENMDEYRRGDVRSAAEMLLEEQSHFEGGTGFYGSYLEFQKHCFDKRYIVRACVEIIRMVVVKVYGYIPVTISLTSPAINEALGDEAIETMTAFLEKCYGDEIDYNIRKERETE